MGLMSINIAMRADKSPGQPKLIVGIVIDQLRTDQLEQLRPLFGEKGFKRLMGNGLYVKDVNFSSYLNDPVASTSLIYTGAYPAVNGVPASRIYSIETRKTEMALADAGAMGNFTNETLSPSNLRVSTLSDEVAIAGNGLNSIYSISPDAQQAIVMAGHAGDCALWINDTDGKWSSTTYYRNFPNFVTLLNRTSPLRQRLDTIRWTPMLPTSRYPIMSGSAFRHTFTGNDKELFQRFKNAAPVNREVTDLAIRAIKDLSLGKHGDAPDMISIGYTAAPYRYSVTANPAMELSDTYVRLDRQIERLLDAIQQYVGLDNSVVFLTSTGYYNDPTSPDDKYRIPTGEVSLKRMESLLNSYLTAKHGNADYIENIIDNQIYFNRKALSNKGHTSESVIADARDFVVKMSGVTGGKTLAEILSDSSAEGELLRHSIDPKKAGDIFLTFNPGWKVIDDTRYPAKSSLQHSGTYASPLLILAPGIKQEEILTPIDATAIAPTIASILHIRSPNGASAKPIF